MYARFRRRRLSLYLQQIVFKWMYSDDQKEDICEIYGIYNEHISAERGDGAF